MKAGLTIKVRNIELLGGFTDAVPSRLYDKDGVQYDVKKYYNAKVAEWTEAMNVEYHYENFGIAA